ncbi:hypothetical protein ACQ4PT_011059 [Festuca glaucescens]
MPLPWRRAPSAGAGAGLAGSSCWAGFHASRESVPLPPTWDKEKAVGGASRAARDSFLFDDGFHASRDSVPLPPTSDREKAIGGAPTPVPANCVAYEFPKADAPGPCATPGWSDLPIDLLIRILHLLELPEALAFRAVCPSWRSASTAAGTVLPPRSPWLVSLVKELLPSLDPQRPVWRGLREPAAASELRSPLDTGRTLKVSFPNGQVVALCGASHGWLIMANKLSNLVLYKPFTAALVPLPPIIGFDPCIEGVYGDDEGKTLVGYRYGCFEGGRVYNLQEVGGHFYDKVVLSGSPSADCAVALAIYLDGKRLSFARVGDARWQQVSRIRRRDDSFADCAYHRGKFYAVTMRGRLKCLNFGGPGELWMETVIAEDDDDIDDVITRYLVPTPWGRLLQLRVILDKHQVNNVRVEIDRLDMKSRKMVGLSSAKALRGHSAFVGQNNPGLLSTKEFPELKPDCIYFTTPRLADYNLFDKRHNEWNGVKVYNLKKRTLEAAFPSGGGDYGTWCPLEVWFTPSR